MIHYFLNNIEIFTTYILLLLYICSISIHKDTAFLPNLVAFFIILTSFLVNVNQEFLDIMDTDIKVFMTVGTIIYFGVYLLYRNIEYIFDDNVQRSSNIEKFSRIIINANKTEESPNILKTVATNYVNSANVEKDVSIANNIIKDEYKENKSVNMNTNSRIMPTLKLANELSSALSESDLKQDVNMPVNSNMDISRLNSANRLNTVDILDKIEFAKMQIVTQDQINELADKVDNRIKNVENNFDILRDDVQFLLNRLTKLLEVITVSIQKYKIKI